MRPNPLHIIDAANAFLQSGVLFAASDLGVFAKLAALGPAGSETLARELGLDPRGARLLLDACVASGLLEKQDGLYRNTAEAGAFLVPGCPGDLSGAIRYNRDVYLAWNSLTDFARTGRPPDPPELHLGGNGDRTRTFVLSMHGRALAIGRAVVDRLDLRGRKKLLDVGGGPGTYSVLISQAYPEIACTVLDLPAVAAIASELIAQQGAAGRVTVLPGDYHNTPFPNGIDAVLFFGVLHQEAPQAILDLFRRAHASLVPGGVLYVMDMMTDGTHTAPAFSALFAVTMALTTASGWVFSDTELRGWLEAAGFTDFAVGPLPAPMPHWLALARKPA